MSTRGGHMSIIDALFNPEMRLLVGVEDEPGGGIRIYIGARYTGIHTHRSNPEDVETVKRAWAMGHQYIPVKDKALCNCPPPDQEDGA